MSIRVVVADDQEIVRAGLTMLLNAQPGIEVVGQAADGQEAVTLARALRPDVCLLDIRMPGMDGVEATRRIAGPDVVEPIAVVIITTFDLDEYVHAALKAGARGFLLKDAGPELLAQAVRAAASGDALIAPRITARLLATLARGRTNTEIAEELFISLSTVKTHVASVMDKLRARNRVEIAIWAHETGRAGPVD